MKTRVVSAIIAVLALATIYYFFRESGLYLICTLVVLGAGYEYSRLTFERAGAPAHIRLTYYFLSIALFACLVWMESFGVSALALLSVFFLTMVLFTVRTAEDLPIALQVQTFGLLGLLYCGVFPALAVKTLKLENGSTWLFGLLAIVFSGDTCAYLAGRVFGRHKLLEPVSPKKTIEGSIGGLVGSAIAGAVLCLVFLPQYPLWAMVLMATVTGGFAQVGDLFESMIKRVAEVKDSGTIMPGHGGILDRIDGVLFGAPVYYVLARFLA